MESEQAFFDYLYRKKVSHAQRFTPEERWLASLEHSDEVVAMMKEGVRAQFPAASDGEVVQIIRERMNRLRRTGSRR